ncbi:unnamed protein product [Amoebophrya sp. A120]|nr:unnamed protein product [Amoebophrya sp. A120]|eukprot:GSA120T00004792001.1
MTSPDSFHPHDTKAERLRSRQRSEVPSTMDPVPAFMEETTSVQLDETSLRLLASSKRATEAYIGVADHLHLGKIDVSRAVKLCEVISTASPLCFQFTPGLYVERSGKGGYVVRATVPIQNGQIISGERRVLPWHASYAQIEDKLLNYLQNTTPEDIAKVNGLFPRTYEEIPRDKVASLQRVDKEVRRIFADGLKCWHGGSPTEKEIQELIRGLAVAKLCAHDDGLHHFGGLYNHSCAPNCEVRGATNLVLVAIKDIEPGEEVCFSYVGMDHLILSACCRSEMLRIGWGANCFCPRCQSELEKQGGLVAADEMHGGDAYEKFQRALLLDELEKGGVGGFQNWIKKLDASSDPILSDWRTVEWKETFVLDRYPLVLASQNIRVEVVSKIRNKQVCENLLRALERDQALVILYRLLELKKNYGPLHSVMMHQTNTVLVGVLYLHALFKKTIPEFGLDTVDLIHDRMETLRQSAVAPDVVSSNDDEVCAIM